MGNPSATLSANEARHLLRRTGFGAPRTTVTQLTGRTRGAAVDGILSFKPTKFKPRGSGTDARLYSWVRYMISSKFQLQEKLVLFWHDHFANSDAKVANDRFMANQNATFRKFCKGNFKDFVKTMNTDVAMLEFLDTVRNFKDVPNENYARELQELFTLGVKDFNGNANYDQADIVQIARAFTGWNYDYRKAKPYFDDYYHDYTADFSERGPKVIYKNHGGFQPTGRNYAPTADDEGAQEINAVIDIIFDHKDTSGKSTVARFITQKLISYFAHPAPSAAFVDTVIAESNFDGAVVDPLKPAWNIGALLRAIFVNDEFYATAAAADPSTGFDASTPKSVKWPTDFVVSTMRLLRMRLQGRYAIVNGGDYRSVHDHLENMGQHLFEPPSVFGWDWETAWLSSSTLLARYGFARDLINARGTSTSRFRPQILVDLNLTDPADIVTAVTDVFGITDQLSDGEKAILADYLTNNGAVSSLDLHDYDTRNLKLHGLFALVMQTAAYQVH